jgi:hypothetical protein
VSKDTHTITTRRVSGPTKGTLQGMMPNGVCRYCGQTKAVMQTRGSPWKACAECLAWKLRMKGSRRGGRV